MVNLKYWQLCNCKKTIMALIILKKYTNIGKYFLFDFNKLKSLDDYSLQKNKKSLNIENFAKHDFFFF
jgi:hypothetical protein